MILTDAQKTAVTDAAIRFKDHTSFYFEAIKRAVPEAAISDAQFGPLVGALEKYKRTLDPAAFVADVQAAL